jgi:smad nuclear-interacting protein 1
MTCCGRETETNLLFEIRESPQRLLPTPTTPMPRRSQSPRRDSSPRRSRRSPDSDRRRPGNDRDEKYNRDSRTRYSREDRDYDRDHRRPREDERRERRNDRDYRRTKDDDTKPRGGRREEPEAPQSRPRSGSPTRSRSPSPVEDKAKPNFGNSGLLAAATNTVKHGDGTSTLLKYNEPPEARKPILNWRLYVFKGQEQVGEFLLLGLYCYYFSPLV